MVSFGMLAAISINFWWLIAALISKKVIPKLGNFRSAILILTMGILPMLVFVILSPGSLDTYHIALAIIAGIADGLGFILFYKAIESQQISNTYATNLIQSVFIVLYGVIALGEAFSTLSIFASVIILIGILLVISTEGVKINKKLIPAILANLMWTAYWIITSQIITDTGQVAFPLALIRASAIISAVIIYFVMFAKKEPVISQKGNLKFILILGVIQGLFDGLGNIASGIAVTYQLFATVGIFIACQPLFVTFISYFVYKERLTRTQAIGMLLAVVGAGIIAIA